MTDEEARTLARLRRCTLWSEFFVVQNYVGLSGLRPNGDTMGDGFDLPILYALKAAGLVDRVESPRIAPINSDGKLGLVSTVYWMVKD